MQCLIELMIWATISKKKKKDTPQLKFVVSKIIIINNHY